jgi:predicted N-acetyltransferase YhbS
MCGTVDVRASLGPVTFRIRAATPADGDAVLRVVGAAFGRDEVPRMVAALEAAGDVLTSLVAEDRDEVVGHVQLNLSL